MHSAANPEVETGVLSNLKIVFSFGKVWDFHQMLAFTIALDGAVQGPQFDSENQRFSFDHHAGCNRMVTLSTCEQVLRALDLGLRPENFNVLVNDWDADTVVALGLLENPSLARNARVRDMVTKVGVVDACGPAAGPLHPLHAHLNAPAGQIQTLATGLRLLEVFHAWAATGELPPKLTQMDRLDRLMFGRLRPKHWVKQTATANPYESYDAIVLETAPGHWLVAKKSDMVHLSLGPADFDPARSGRYMPTLLGKLAEAEARKGCPPQENWGGGSSVGGSPRRKDGTGSALTSAEIWEIVKNF